MAVTRIDDRCCGPRSTRAPAPNDQPPSVGKARRGGACIIGSPLSRLDACARRSRRRRQGEESPTADQAGDERDTKSGCSTDTVTHCGSPLVCPGVVVVTVIVDSSTFMFLVTVPRY
jgi:hypothetical protein